MKAHIKKVTVTEIYLYGDGTARIRIDGEATEFQSFVAEEFARRLKPGDELTITLEKP